MKKQSISIVMMLLSLIIHSQELLPKVVPVSPEAASLGKYGDIPVNLATGRINYSIPIFTIKEGGFELPIYLSYNHSGLLAEEDPGLVGLGWTLHAGGMIVRQLRGRPDEEQSKGYVGGNIGKNWVIPYHFGEWNSLPASERRSKEFNLFDGSNTGRLDTQPDKFIVNAGNLSGSFSYNALGASIFYPHKNYKVSKANSNYTIIDDKGITYTFNDKEQTTSEGLSNYSDGNDIPLNYISAWGLTNITFPDSNRTITFEYTNGANYEKIGNSESKIVLLSSSGNAPSCSNSPYNRSSVLTTVFHKKQISKINFSNGSIYFDVRTVPSGSSSRTKNYLYSITIKNKLNQTISSYEFVYDNLMSNFKLLKEVKKYGNNNSEIPFYKLEYKETPPLSINYTSQDTWGYYNGAINSNLINGNRNVNFSKSSTGALTKIIYPTKGYTQIKYESNTVPLLGNEFLSGGQCYTTPINASETIIAKSGLGNNPSPPSKTILIKADQIIKVQLKTTTGQDGEAYSIVGKVTSNGVFKCNEETICDNSTCASSATTLSEHGVYLASNKNTTSYFKVSAGTQLKLSANVVSSSGYSEAKVIVSYFNPDLITPSNNYVEVGGIRVSSTKDCTENNRCIAKKYHYKLPDETTSGKILSYPRYTYQSEVISTTGNCVKKHILSSSSIPLASFQGAPVLYEQVEILHNNDETKGKTIKYFTNQQNPSPTFPFPSQNPKDWKKGNLKKEEIYTWKENRFQLIKKTENTYESFYPTYSGGYQNHKYSIGIVAGKYKTVYIPGAGMGNNAQVSGDPTLYQTGFYNNKPEFYHLTSSKTTEYLNGKEQITATNYNYDNLTGYLKEQLTNNSEQKTLKIINTYPNSGSLFNQNRISEPINVKTYKNTTQLNEQNTVYTNFGSLHLPQKIQTSKGTVTLEDRVVYHSYDNKGNPTEVSKKDGTHIVYIWGYNQTQPVAKIENAKSSDIPQNYIDNIQNKSNADNDREIDKTDNQGNITKYTGNEGQLRIALNALRNVSSLSKSQITTYTYDPLVGVTSITDPRGETVYYQYDDFNRLQYIKDKDGKILKETKYNYKTN